VTGPAPKKTILVAEDEKESRDLVGELLTQAGYSVLYASNGVEAVNIAGKWAVDLIVMDMMMPVMDGIKATRKLKSDILTARVPILALTGDAGNALRQEATEAGCDTFMLKPINPIAFVGLVHHWVKR
jgi:CheY-like chemotaxis protein